MADFSSALSVIDTIVDAATNALSAARTPATAIPPPMLLMAAQRPGLSAIDIVSRIIKRRESAGAPVGALPDGSPSVEEKLERIRIEEIVDALKYDARIDIAIKPGVPVLTNGANSGGPLVGIGFTTSFGSGNGVII